MCVRVCVHTHSPLCRECTDTLCRGDNTHSQALHTRSYTRTLTSVTGVHWHSVSLYSQTKTAAAAAAAAPAPCCAEARHDVGCQRQRISYQMPFASPAALVTAGVHAATAGPGAAAWP